MSFGDWFTELIILPFRFLAWILDGETWRNAWRKITSLKGWITVISHAGVAFVFWLLAWTTHPFLPEPMGRLTIYEWGFITTLFVGAAILSIVEDLDVLSTQARKILQLSIHVLTLTTLALLTATASASNFWHPSTGYLMVAAATLVTLYNVPFRSIFERRQTSPWSAQLTIQLVYLFGFAMIYHPWT